jgi:hypothetical protein
VSRPSGRARARVRRKLVEMGVSPDLIDETTTIGALREESMLFVYLLLVAAERDAVEPFPEDLVDASDLVGDFLHYAQLREEQQSA